MVLSDDDDEVDDVDPPSAPEDVLVGSEEVEVVAPPAPPPAPVVELASSPQPATMRTTAIDDFTFIERRCLSSRRASTARGSA